MSYTLPSYPITLSSLADDSIFYGVNTPSATPAYGKFTGATLATYLSTKYPLQKSIIVAKNGNDTTGNGSLLAPYLTIGEAISAATAGTLIQVYAGTYTEDITLPEGVTVQGLSFPETTNNSTTQTVIAGTITLSSSSQVASLSIAPIDNYGVIVSGVSPISAQIDNCFIWANSGALGCINNINTDAASTLIVNNTECYVSDSNGGQFVFGSEPSSKGVAIFSSCSLECTDNIDNVCLNIQGGLLVGANFSTIAGIVDVSNSSIYKGKYSYHNTIASPIFQTESTSLTPSRLDFCTINTEATPAIAGTGLFGYSNLVFENTGHGFQSTLNDGNGALPSSTPAFNLSGVALRSAINNGDVQFDGTHLYVSIGGVNYQLDQQAFNNQTVAAWTPVASGTATIGGSLTAKSTFGNWICFTGTLVYAATADVTAASITGLPSAHAGQNFPVTITSSGLAGEVIPQAILTGNTINFYSANTGVPLTNAQLSEKTIIISGTYFI